MIFGCQSLLGNSDARSHCATRFVFDRPVGSEHCVVASSSLSGRELCASHSRRLAPSTSHTRPPSLAVAGGCPARSSLGPTPTRCTHTHSPQRVVAWLDPSNATSHSTPIVVVSPDPQLCYRSLSLPVSRARFTAPPTPPSHASIPLSNPCPRGGRIRV
jgi:hypothetical protein